MRKITAACVLATAAALSAAPTALATPTIVQFTASAVPIPGFPGTGDKPGAGAMVKGYAKISGSEYGGAPEPLVGLTLQGPAGTTLHRQGFATCAQTVLERQGPQGCPKASALGVGSALGVVTFGGERVPEKASIEPFFAPDGGFEVYILGVTPALVEVIGKGHLAPAAPGYGPTVVGEIPLIEPVPEGFDASYEEGTVTVGAALRRDGHVISYITLPRRCPRGGWPVKLEMRFMGGGEAAASAKMGCSGG